MWAYLEFNTQVLEIRCIATVCRYTKEISLDNFPNKPLGVASFFGVEFANEATDFRKLQSF